jgi:hypothetical protein
VNEDYEAVALEQQRQALEDEAHRVRAEHEAMVASTWMEVPLGPLLAGDVQPPQPTILQRTDGRHLLYAGKTHLLLGEFETGKTWAALAAAVELIRSGSHVLWIDFEDEAGTFALRLRQLGLEDAAIRRCAHYVRPDQPLRGPGRAALAEMGSRYDPALVVLDGVTEAMALHGWNPDKMTDVAEFYALFPRRIDQTDAAVVMIDHVVKAKDERGRYAIGSQHKMAAVNGAAYRFDVEGTPLSPGRPGKVRVTVVKDRPGAVRAFAGSGKEAGTLRLEPMPDRGLDALDVTLEPRTVVDDHDSFTDMVTRVAAWLTEQSEPVSQSRVEDGVTGDRGDIRNALKTLVGQGYVELTRGPNRSKLHRLVRPFGGSAESPAL